MEKAIIRKWEDFKELKISNYFSYVKKEDENEFIRILFNNYNIKVNPKYGDIRKIIQALNSLGGNFEYKEVEVIDTYKKLHKFNERVARLNNEGLYYLLDPDARYYRKFCNFENECKGIYNYEEIEEMFNVELKILKED